MSVTVEGLTKKFAPGGRPAVHQATFTAPSGAITTLLGPSGSGKTTVLRMIAGLEAADAGTVRLGALDCTRLPVRERGVGVVFQGYALFKHLSVRRNIAFGLEVRRRPKAEIDRRVEELLALVQLEALGDRLPDQLSGGQQQRVAFARALAIEPRVLLLDEPFGALDSRVRVELRTWLAELHRKTHLTTILVTHDQDEALELSQQVVVMNEGRIEQIGSPDEIYDRPATAFVAAFIGNANVLRGTVKEGQAALGAHALGALGSAPEGSAVQAFVRPDEVKLARADPDAPAMSLGLVEALTRIGGFVKVGLRLPSGERLTVELGKAEFEALSVSQGDRVLVDLGGAKIFVEDYSI
ncbi:MAG: ABC transporter ATP-binding protein [Myxococcaceae bacterium]|nr:ABC transporter ATP-binding protein [Myxococcaceae bacterium]